MERPLTATRAGWTNSPILHPSSAPSCFSTASRLPADQSSVPAYLSRKSDESIKRPRFIQGFLHRLRVKWKFLREEVPDPVRNIFEEFDLFLHDLQELSGDTLRPVTMMPAFWINGSLSSRKRDNGICKTYCPFSQ